MPKSKLAKLKNELEAAEKDVRYKEAQLSELKEQVSRARLRMQELEGEVQSNVALEDDVQALLYHQQQTAAAFKDYENRVLALELQGLVERWRAMDVEEMAQQNHELREECMRLHQENMELSRSVAEGSLHARRDLARIELALEMTVKGKMQKMHAKLRRELYDEMDDKTKIMVHNHGALQDHMQLLAGQAATLDRQYRALQADRARYKVDADVAASLGEQQAAQTVELRRQLKQAYQAIEVQRRKLAESEARAEAAWDEAMRAGSRAAAAAARAASASAAAAGGPHGAGTGGTVLEGDGDSAYGMAGGEGAEVAALEAQLRHGRQRFERMRLQRDRWRERSLLYERACAQLQAALQTLQDQARLSLPGGVKQDLDAIWCAAKAAPDPETGQVSTPVAGGAWALSPPPAASRPATARSGHSGASPRAGGESGEWGAGQVGGKGWAVGGGAGAARMRASSARPAAAGAVAPGPWHAHGSGAGVSLGGLPARPQTAMDPTTAARRAAEQIRRSVNAPAGSRPASAYPGHAAGGSGHGHGGAGRGGAGGEAQREELVYEEEVEEDDEPVEPPGATAAAAAAATVPAAAVLSGSANPGAGWGSGSGAEGEGRSTSPPGRVPVSRLYSEAAEPFKTAWQPGYQPVSDLRPLSPPAHGPPSFGTSGASTSLGLGLSASGFGAGSAAGPLSSMELPPARTPGSVRPHSALPAARLEPPAGQPQPRWAPGRSLTGLTSSPTPTVDAAGPGGAAAPGPEPSLQGSAPRPHGASDASGARSPTPSPPRTRTPPGSAGEAAEAEWQAWQGQRQRAQSPQYAEIARNTSRNLPLSVALAINAASDGLVASAAAGTTSTGPAASVAQQQPQAPPITSLGPGLVPPVSVGGGAIYTVAHAASKIPTPGHPGASEAAIAGAATAGGLGAGALTSGGLLPHSAAAAVSASQAAAAQYLQTYGSGGGAASASAAAATGTSSRGAPAGTPGGPGAALTNPSTMLNALRRPPSAAKKLSGADVMFAGSRPNSARSQSGSAAASARGPLASSRGNSLSGLGGSGSAR